jgi:hypothetical protein
MKRATCRASSSSTPGVPLLRVPVMYYRAPPPPSKHWRREAAPQWDPTWGREWSKRNKDGDKDARKGRK